MPDSSLLVTKFIIPPARRVLLPREHLLAILDRSWSNPLTLVSAGAGFGKTTLLSAWANRNSGRVAWLMLDEQDNDPARFWACVIAALRQSGQHLSAVGETTLAMLQSPQPSPLTSALTSLINDLASLAPDAALILDDYHLISEQMIHESLQFVLDHLPACLHLLLASRVDPPLALTRLRVRGQLVEIRDTDLRLDSRGAAGFLTEVMNLTLQERDIQLLETRTEGWIAGLQLAALSVQRHDDMSAFIQAFSGSQRFVLDYVQEEILEPLPESQQRFLLYTSVLDRMNADLCRRLTGERASQQMLEELERANLFLIPLDEERRWYRWHTLFREVLLARLRAREPEQVARLHREAALWYQAQGWPREAISHAQATQDFAFVADLLEGCVERLSQQGELQTLLVWIKMLPLEVLRAHPRLATTYTLVFHVLFPFSTQQAEERTYIHQLLAGVEQELECGDQSAVPQAEQYRLRYRITILSGWERVSEALSLGNVEELGRFAEQAQGLTLDDDPIWQLHRLGPFSMAWRMAGNFPPMVAALEESRKSIQVMQNRYLEAQILWGLIVALIALGRLAEAHDHCDALRQLVAGLGDPLPLAAYPDVFQAQLAYARNQLEVARHEARIAIEKTTPLQYMDILMMAYEALIHVSIAQSDLWGAEQALGEMERVNRYAGIPLFRPWVESLQVQLWLAQGNLTRAVEWAESTPYRRAGLVYSHEIASLALVHVYLADGRYPQALQLLEELQNSAELVARVGSLVAVLALRVAALQASGRARESLSVLDRLLAEASPERYLRVFLDAGEPMHRALQTWLKASRRTASPALVSYAQTALAAFADAGHQLTLQETTPLVSNAPPSASGEAAPPPYEPLTLREQEVLHLLSQGATNQEIADNLVVSLATAKKHVASILRKLGAENRTQAVARARSLSLL
jgi:LuxR family transcriptional regulator, maltose regulon positive regulatory protein